MDSHEATYTVPLALFDVVPVVLSVVGCWCLARLSARAVPSVRLAALVGVVLIGIGGGAKALWKILLTAAEVDLTWMEQMLFPFLSVGFVLLAWALWSGLVGRRVVAWPFALLLVVGAGGAVAAGSMQPLLGVAATMSLITSGLGVRWAARNRDLLAAVLFVVGMVASVGLAFLGSDRIEQTLALQWIEEITNVVGQGAFAVAAVRLLRHPFRPDAVDVSDRIDLTTPTTATTATTATTSSEEIARG